MGEEKNSEESSEVDYRDSSEKMIKESLKLTEEIHKMTKSIKSYLMWQQIFSFVKIVIFLAPIILGFIFLPRLIQDFTNNPGKLLNNSFFSTYLQSLTETMTDQLMKQEIDLNSLKFK